MHISSILSLMQTFYHQLNINKLHKKNMKWQLNTYLYLFRGYTPSWVFRFIVFFIHDGIISYPNAKVDKKFFKSWDLHIPHRLRDLLWMVRTWSSVAPIFSSLLMSRASSSRSLLKVITSFWHTFLTWMNPMILGGHSRWPSPLLHSSLLLSLLQVVLWFERPLWLHGLCILDLH